MQNYKFTSESVTEGHPDKLCDQISDAVLDAYLAGDTQARVACETLAGNGFIVVTGEVAANCSVDIDTLARDTIHRIGYTEPFEIDVAMNRQSPDIALGVDKFGAGDQGMMFGYATDETEDFMPLPIHLAHKLTRQLTDVRTTGTLPYLAPDGKAQVTVEYRDGTPFGIDSVVISAQHTAEVDIEMLRYDIKAHVIDFVLQNYALSTTNTKIHINPTGRFVIGGPAADAGLTGRKIIVDTYGGFARHGGGAFSGKDPTKVDRSAAYMARYIAKNLVAAGLANRLELQISYAIGVAEPVSITLDTFGTGKASDAEILALIHKHFDLRPAAIIERLDLRRPIYTQTAAYGHFGRNDLDLPWERLDMAEVPR